MRFAEVAGETFQGSEKSVMRNWRKGESCHVAAGHGATPSPAVTCKVENAPKDSNAFAKRFLARVLQVLLGFFSRRMVK